MVINSTDFLYYSLFLSLFVPTDSLAHPLPHSDTTSTICSNSHLCTTPSFIAKTNTPLGPAYGSVDLSGTIKYTVRYGSASRWDQSYVAIKWESPNASNTTASPLPCPQPGLAVSDFEENCLSMILYVPPTARLSEPVPTLMWIPGGSFITGSATNTGLDGSNLAVATNSIVAVIQYRLGVLGLLSPDGTTNLAVKDVVTALSFLRTVLPSFGGNPSKITLAGQSSGGTMIRALLAVPSASSLFQSAIIQSDPMDYGFLSITTQKKLQSYLNPLLNCNPSDRSCLDALTLDTIIDAQQDLLQNATTIDPSTGQGEPIRPVHDGSFIASTLDSSSPFPRVSKPILISTVLDEAGPAIYSTLPDTIPEDEFPFIVNATFGTTRTNTILASPFYQPSSNPNDSDARTQLQTLGTDYLWKCSSWTFARTWVRNGGRAYVGLYVVGATYPDNSEIPFCTQAGSVCHEDDIEIVFGTVPNPTAAQATLTAQMHQRYKAFLRTGDPNTAHMEAWKPSTTSEVHAILLGGTGMAHIGACDPSFWGEAVQYDYQVYGI